MRGLIVWGCLLGIVGFSFADEPAGIAKQQAAGTSAALSADSKSLLPDSLGNTDPAAILKDYPPDTEGTPTPPAEALKKATLPPGFKMTTFAHEPDVLQPIAINVDDRGRLWVAECFSYPQYSKTGHDRLTILEDTDGDGVHDKRRVFWDRGNYLTGFQLGHGGVWVCCAPDLLFIPDRDGDDVPDSPPQVILTGWGVQGKHNVVNALQWGPDGWLYGCNGITSPSRVGTPDTPEEKRTPIECGVWRYHPTRKTFEVVMHGGTNPWGIDWNAEGEAFVTNCVIGHLFHVIPGAHYQRMFGQDLNPYAYELMPPTSEHLHWQGGDWTKARGGADIDALGGGHAHSGAVFMLGDQWPAEMRGDILMCNIHGTRINRDHIDKTSTGYVGRYRPDLINWHDPWFRGVAFATAPDGSIYVADWCDIGECHDYKEVHRNSGRIYKFWYGELKKWKPEDLKLAEKEPWEVDAIKDPWIARRVLQYASAHSEKYTDDDYLKVLMTIGMRNPVLTPDQAPHIQYAMSVLLTAGENRINKLIENIASHKEEAIQDVLFHSAFYEGENQTKNKTPDVLRAADLRRTVAFAEANWKLDDKNLEEIHNLNSGDVLMALLGNLRYAGIDTHRKVLAQLWKNPIWQNPVPTKEANYGEWAAHRNLQCMTWYAMEPVVAADPKWAVDQLLACPDPFLHGLIIRRLLDQKEGWQLVPPLAALFGKAELWQDPDRSGALLTALQSSLAGRKNLPFLKDWTALSEKLQAHPDNRVHMQALELSYQFGDPAIVPVLLKIVGDARKSTAERERALQLLARGKDAKLATQLPSLLDDKELRTATIRALALYELETTPNLLLSNYQEFNPDQKLSAVETLASRKPWAAALLTALDQKKLPRADIPSYIARQIELFKDKALSKQLREGWGMVRTSTEATQKRKEELKTVLTADALQSANHAAGKLLFAENCAKCHKLFGEGAAVGPELTGAQRGNLDYLLENILEPSASVARDYRLSVVTLNDGRILSGVVLEENAATVKLRTTDSDQTISKSDIDELTTTNQSAMPEGILERFNEKQIRDLFGYLQGAK